MVRDEEVRQKIERLIAQLSVFTSNGRIHWSETAGPDAFRAMLKGGMVRIERSMNLDDDGNEVESFFLTLLDGKARELEDYYPTRDSSQEHALIELWTMARRDASGTADVLDSLLGETSAKKQ